MAGSTGHVLSVLICPHGALRKWARWSRWVVGLVLCRGEVRGGEGGGGGGRGGRTTFGHSAHVTEGKVQASTQVPISNEDDAACNETTTLKAGWILHTASTHMYTGRVVVGEARGQLLTEQGGGHGIFNRVAGRGVKGAQVNAATPACGAPLRCPQHAGIACFSPHAKIQALHLLLQPLSRGEKSGFSNQHTVTHIPEAAL
eukprot:1158163-Pelagomonas_calceolata.AAC.13